MMGARPKILMVGAALAAAFAVTGCATEKYVNEKVGAVDTHVNAVSGQVSDVSARVSDHDTKLANLDKTSQDALQRLTEALQS